jgi:flagellar basal body L-ring protein FlgH
MRQPLSSSSDSNHRQDVARYVTAAINAFFLMIACTVSTDAAQMINLFSDHRAMRVDDIVTIMIIESAKAGSESGTTTSKENSMGVEGSGGSGALRMIPGLNLSGGSKVDYDGKGGTSRT